MDSHLLTVAQAAERLGTTIPRLRRLLARPEMTDCSQIVPVETLRGTRTSMVVPVSEIARLRAALQAGDLPANAKKQAQKPPITFSEMEFMALQTTLRRTEELLVSKNQELLAKEQIIVLLREKIRELEKSGVIRFEEQKHSDNVPVAENEFRLEMPPQLSRLPPRIPPTAREEPKTAWARFYRWFREA